MGLGVYLAVRSFTYATYDSVSILTKYDYISSDVTKSISEMVIQNIKYLQQFFWVENDLSSPLGTFLKMHNGLLLHTEFPTCMRHFA